MNLFLTHWWNIHLYCADIHQYPCLLGHNKCFSLSQACTMRMNQNKHLLPCRNGAHLESCRHFECNMMFKCNDNYCIPWEYVCNGRWDCPTGDDEENMCDFVSICNGGFKCRNTEYICIHLGQICDEIENCPAGDDEKLCDLHHIRCPQGCSCLVYGCVCSKAFIVSQNMYPYKCLVLNNVQSLQTKQISEVFQNLSMLRFSNSSSIEVCLLHLIHVTYLFATHNTHCCQQISTHCFKKSSKLINLLLVDNKIAKILPEAFAYLPSLGILNLSHNSFSYFPKNTFDFSDQLTTLSLFGIVWSHFDAESLNFPNLQCIQSHNLQICCAVYMSKKCTHNKEQHGQCQSLLASTLSEFVCVMVVILLLSLNISSVLVHLKLHKSKECLSILVASINFGDILWGLYLSCLLITNYTLQGHAFSDDSFWQSSYQCYLTGTLAMCSSFVCPIFLSLLAFCRMSVTLYPFDSNFLDRHFVIELSKYVFSCCIMLSFLPAVILWFSNVSIPTITCLMYADPYSQVDLVKVIAIFICIIHLCALICIGVANYMTWATVSASCRNVGKSKSCAFMVAQWMFMGGSSLLSWICTYIIYLSLFTFGNPTQILMWILVTLSPVNSLFNPVVLLCASLRSVHKWWGTECLCFK